MVSLKGIVVAVVIFFTMALNLNLVRAEQESSADSLEGQEAIKAIDLGEQTTIKIDDNLAVIPDIQWLWGEVSSIDLAARQLIVKYFDYDADAKKDITITLDDKTNFENVKDISQIKELDTVSIDYVFGPEGKNIAKNISIEKPDDSQEAPQLKEDTEIAPEVTPGLKQ